METYLAHHGILGMKWGVRRYQNEDGTLTAAGKKRYGSADAKEMSRKSSANANRAALAGGGATALVGGAKRAASRAASLASESKEAAGRAEFAERSLMKYYSPGKDYISPRDGRTYSGVRAIDQATADKYDALARASNYASVARAATTVAGIVSGVGAVTTIGFGAIAAGQLAYSAYLKHQAKKVQNKEA